MIYPIKPVAKPRMTRRDRWTEPPRLCVAKYRAFKDEVRIRGVQLPAEGAHVTFHIEMPKSWPQSKKAKKKGTPHQTTPDVDNLLKALADAIFNDDSHIWDVRVTKLWATEDGIEITPIN